jgi:hypothetical protein
MKNTRIQKFCYRTSLLMVGAILSFFVFRGATSVVIRAQSASGSPFVVRQLNLVNRDGTMPLAEAYVIAVRSDRATSTSRTLPGGGESDMIRLVVLPDGEYFHTNPTLQLITSGTYNSADLRGKLGPTKVNPDCSGASPAPAVVTGQDMVLGRNVSVLVRTTATGDKTTEWLDPALGCIALRRTTDYVNPSGSSVRLRETNTVSLVLGEPDSSYFSRPSGYREVPPSEQERLWAEHVHAKPPGGVVGTQAIDDVYQKSRQPR